MIRHNLLLIFRNFKRFKSTFLINLIGLSTGLACVLLIYLWVRDEWSMDKFHEQDARLFSVMTNSPRSESIETSTTTQAILGEALQQEVPEIEYAVTTLGDNFDLTLSVDDRHILSRGTYAEKDFFKIFSFELVAGSADLVLTDKKSIVLSEAAAVALFKSSADAVGKVIQWQFPYGKDEAYVSGVFKNIPEQSSYRFDFVQPFEIYKQLVGQESLHWGNFGCNTFVLLKKHTDVAAVNAKIEGFVARKAPGETTTLFLIPYASYYLYGTYRDGVQSGGRIEYVKLFALIGIFILIIACINFMNLSTAKATRRVREVGVKKAIGASRRTLITQYMGESMMMAVLSLLVAILIVDLSTPKFNEITGKHLSLELDGSMLLALFIITTITGVVAGSYPAFYLSGFNPASVLKGKLTGQAASVLELFARKGLIIFQFSLSILFIVLVWVIYKQIDFVQTKNLGYDKDNVMYLKPEGPVSQQLEAFINEVKNVPGVLNSSSIARTIVGARNASVGYFNWEGKDPKAIIPFEIVNGNYDLIETLGISLVAGRTFSKDFASDTAALIFNEAAVAVMGLKDPIGKNFNLWGKDMKIVGVTKDFHFESLHEKVKPLFFRLAPAEAEQVLIKIEAGKETETLSRLEKMYKKFNPGYTFNYTFLDKDYQAQYNAERRVATLSKYFAGLAIVISCLGLFGLAAFTAERRQKEIGIRKVLGSGEWRIIYLLSADFTKMVLVAAIIALPMSYVLATMWLDGFAFKISLMWWYFPLAGIVALVIAWLTVGMQAWNASRLNPTECLKEE